MSKIIKRIEILKSDEREKIARADFVDSFFHMQNPSKTLGLFHKFLLIHDKNICKNYENMFKEMRKCIK